MLAFPPASTPFALPAILAAMSSPVKIFPTSIVIAATVIAALLYWFAADRPQTSTADRLDQMQAEIDDLRASLEEVEARARDAGQTVDDLSFDLQHSPGSVIGER
jgi:hypothetical protein